MRLNKIKSSRNSRKRGKEKKLADSKLEEENEEKTREIEKLEAKLAELQETLIEVEAREKQYIVRENEAAIREKESRDRIKHNRKLIVELRAHSEGGGKAAREKRKERTRRNLKILQLNPRPTQA